MLTKCATRGEGFYQFARRLSQQHQRYFLERELAPEVIARFDDEVALPCRSRQDRAQQADFDRFLADYFAQT